MTSRKCKNLQSTKLECDLQLPFRKFFYLEPEKWSKLRIFADRSVLTSSLILNG
ncbi:hypothetical protein Hanom_Chr16g01464951 [Helianthus anomalus]